MRTRALRWTRPVRPRPGATAPRALMVSLRARPGGHDESGAGRGGSRSGPRGGEPGAAQHSRRRGSPASAGCPRRPGRSAGPCGSAGWGECRRRPVLRGRRRTGPQMRSCTPEAPRPATARADARWARAVQWCSDADGPSGSLVRRAATAPGLRRPTAPHRSLGASQALPAPRAAAGGSASAGQAERRGEPTGSER